jgi:hypothetical protein
MLLLLLPVLVLEASTSTVLVLYYLSDATLQQHRLTNSHRFQLSCTNRYE